MSAMPTFRAAEPSCETGLPQAALCALRAQLAAEEIVLDEQERRFHSQDVFGQGRVVDAVLRPADAEHARLAQRTLCAHGVAVLPRGGGLSYTDAYLSPQGPAAVLDLARLDRLVELNLADRYVVVEAGMTWAALDAALEPHGVRTPYWGPLSGLRSTVGGALSQGSVFLGSGLHGAVGDSVLGLEVVDAGGEWLRTGAAAAGNVPPFMRWFGPDLTGAFIGDAGALGTKLRASLRLIPRPAALGCLSFDFADRTALMGAMSEVSRQALAAECFAFDPFLVDVRLRRASLMSDARTLLGVVRQSGVRAGARLVAAGRGFVPAQRWTVHATLEAADKGALAARMVAARRVLAGAGGHEIDASIPTALRGMPFSPPNSMLGPAGERWVPVHGVFAHSQAAQGLAACERAIARHAPAMQAHGIRHGCLLTTVAAQGMLVEPVFFWPDSHSLYHRRMVEPAYRERAGEPGENLAGRAAIAHLKRDVADAMREAGAVHFQIGRFYDWRRGRDRLALALHDALKQAMDPQGLLNPGVLR